MSITLKQIPVALQRRASLLPCDGVKRYKVGKDTDLTYSEAYAAISKESDLGPNDRGGRVLKRGTANRLAKLNRLYFRVAQKFVTAAIAKLQAEQEASKLNGVVAAPSTPEEIDDGGAVGTEVQVDVVATVQAVLEAAVPINPVALLLPGDRRHICQQDGQSVGMLFCNKGGFRCVIDGQEARSRNGAKMADLITTALSGPGWTLAAV